MALCCSFCKYWLVLVSICNKQQLNIYILYILYSFISFNIMNQKLHHHQPVFNNITNIIKPIFWLFCRVQSSFELPTFWFDLYHHPVFLRISPCFIRKVINERFRRDHWLFGCKPQLEGTPAQRSETKGSCFHDSTTSGGNDEEEDDDDDDDDGMAKMPEMSCLGGWIKTLLISVPRSMFRDACGEGEVAHG